MYLRRRFAFILLLGISAPYWGVYTYLSLRQAANWKHFIEEKQSEARENEVVWLKIGKNEPIHWERANEFAYKGRMYDVWEKRDIGDSVWYYCKWDKEDTEIHRLKIRLQALPSNPKEGGEDWIQWYKMHLYVYAAEKARTKVWAKHPHTGVNVGLPKDPARSVPKPPPEFFG